MGLKSTRDKVVRFEPRHTRNWRRLGRYCRCGMRWPCLDAHLPSTIAPYLQNMPAPRSKPADRAPNGSPHRPSGMGGQRLLHVASRPDWNCRECGTEWPCESAKIEITADWADDRIGMCVHLATLMYEAIDDLLEFDAEQLSPPELYRRFLRWPDQIAETEAIARLSARPGEP